MNRVFLILLLLCLCGCKPPAEAPPTAAVLTNTPPVQNDPIIIRYIDLQTDKSMSGRDLSYFVNLSSRARPLFWVTNRGATPIVVRLSVETLSNGSWLPGTNNFTLVFHTEEKTINDGKTSFRRKELQTLPGHQAAYAAPQYYGGTSPRMIIPTTNSWRVKASVQEQLKGVQRTVAAVKNYPDISKLPGNTNVLAAFRTNVSYFGPPTEVYSDKVDPLDDGSK